MEKETVKKTYFSGFDYLKVFFALAVVAWHTKALGATELAKLGSNLHFKDIVYGNFFLIAVPLFIQISLFLYLKNREEKSAYFLKRIIYLFTLYFFYFALYLLIFRTSYTGKLFNLENWLSAGGTPLYFLLVLAVLTISTEVMLLIKKFISEKIFNIICIVLLLSSIAFLIIKPYLAQYIPSQYWRLLMAHWSFINFVPYIFSSFLFFDFYKKGFLARKDIRPEILLTLIGLSLIIPFEYKYLSNEFVLKYSELIIQPYSRLSIFISTFLVFYIFLSRNFYAPSWIKSIAGLTLGIFVLHIFIINLFAGHFFKFYFLYKESYIVFLIVLTISAVLTLGLKEKKLM